MKVTFLNTFEQHGGAGLAGYRLYQSLKKHTKVEVAYLAQFYGKFKKYELKNLPALTRIGLEKMNLKSKIRNASDLYKFETGQYGRVPGSKDLWSADLIHLHWVNQGYLSLKALHRIAEIKPVIWTMHDMWPFTGGCSYSNNCVQYKVQCGNCPMLKFPAEDDISFQIWKQKMKVYDSGRITLVGPSKWISEKARESSIGEHASIFQIPNPIDTDFFSPGDRFTARNNLGIEAGKFILLFGAQNIDDERKGFWSLKNSLKMLRQTRPEVADKIILLVFGETNHPEKIKNQAVKTHYAGHVRNPAKLRELYQAANWYVHPAKIDNLPNTVVEAIATGIPVIGFNTGGVKEIIQDGFNGILSLVSDEEQLSQSIIKAIENPETEITYGKNARSYALENYSMENVALKYLNIYNQILKPPGIS